MGNESVRIEVRDSNWAVHRRGLLASANNHNNNESSVCNTNIVIDLKGLKQGCNSSVICFIECLANRLRSHVARLYLMCLGLALGDFGAGV